MSHVTQIALDGIAIGSSYALVGLGFTLVFGVLGVMNVAHADFYTLGAYTSIWIGVSAGLGSVVGLLAAIVAGAGAGGLLYLLVLRRLSVDQLLAVFIATLGLSFFIQHLIARIVGPQSRASTPLFDSSFHDVAGVSISDAQLVLIVSTLLIAVGLVLWIGRTQMGRDMRALAENAMLARTVGVRAAVVFAATLAVASAIAALGGVLVTNFTETVTPFASNEVALKMFVVAMVAGAGSVGGAAVAGFGLGVVESFAVSAFGSGWQHVAGLLILVAVLMFRPQGLFAGAARVG